MALQWHHDGRDGVSNNQCLDCLPNRLFRRRSKKTSKLCVTGLCEGNPPVTGGFPSQRASNAENVSIWLHHHTLVLSVNKPFPEPMLTQIYVATDDVASLGLNGLTSQLDGFVIFATTVLHSETMTVVYYWSIIYECFFEDHGIMSEEILGIDVSLLRTLDGLPWQKVIFRVWSYFSNAYDLYIYTYIYILTRHVYGWWKHV